MVSLSQLLARALLAAESGIFFGTFPQVILSNKQRCTLGKITFNVRYKFQAPRRFFVVVYTGAVVTFFPVSWRPHS